MDLEKAHHKVEDETEKRLLQTLLAEPSRQGLTARLGRCPAFVGATGAVSWPGIETANQNDLDIVKWFCSQAGVTSADLSKGIALPPVAPLHPSQSSKSLGIIDGVVVAIIIILFITEGRLIARYIITTTSLKSAWMMLSLFWEQMQWSRGLAKRLRWCRKEAWDSIFTTSANPLFRHILLPRDFLLRTTFLCSP